MRIRLSELNDRLKKDTEALTDARRRGPRAMRRIKGSPPGTMLAYILSPDVVRTISQAVNMVTISSISALFDDEISGPELNHSTLGMAFQLRALSLILYTSLFPNARSK